MCKIYFQKSNKLLKSVLNAYQQASEELSAIDIARKLLRD